MEDESLRKVAIAVRVGEILSARWMEAALTKISAVV